MQCKYVKQDGSRCLREALPNSEKGYCILHEDWDSKDAEETKKEFYREIEEGIGDFEGCILPEIDLSGKEIIGDIVFYDATIKGGVLFNGAIIRGNVYFIKAVIEGYAQFRGATIKGNTEFFGATIDGFTLFDEATIVGLACFEHINTASLTFGGTKFNNLWTQEYACRNAKILLESRGNRELVDYHFYREMEAKRKQKHPVIRFLELPVQYIFGYGVYPWRVIATWLLTVFSLAFVYWIGNGVEAANSLVEYIYFSVVTAATPGYGGYRPSPGFYQGLASFEAIFGTFMWAAFIATFARKYMR